MDELLNEQRVTLRQYLRAAQQAGKLDEVRMLQSQLQELENFSLATNE